MMVVPGSAEYWRLFDGFEHTAFRLEVLQAYASDNEASPLCDFAAGRPCPSLPGKDRWVARVAAATAAGKVMQRVHVVTQPLSEYVQYEVAWSYPPNVTAGEDIRILVAGEGDPLLQEADYWLFDSRTLVRMCYEEGRLIGALLVSDPAQIVRGNWLRDLAMHRATALGSFVQWHAGLLRERVS